jgi:biotin transport system substrate-specific component
MNEKRSITTKHLVLVAFFVALTAIGARVEIPLPYVPFTLQTFFVLLAGLLLGSRLGALSQIVYVSIGLLGLPVFARGGGIGYIVQPTFGYLIGFVPAAYVVGVLVEKKPQAVRSHFFLASFCGLAIVYVFGLFYLWLCTNLFLGKELDVYQTVKIGFLFLLPGAALKGTVAAVVGAEVRKRLAVELAEP